MEEKKPQIVSLLSLSLAPPPGLNAPPLTSNAPSINSCLGQKLPMSKPALPSVMSLDLSKTIPRSLIGGLQPLAMPKPLEPKKSDAWTRNLSNSRKFHSSADTADVEEQEHLLEELSNLTVEEIIEQETKTWTRTCPADLYYERDTKNFRVMHATKRLKDLCDRFYTNLIAPGIEARLSWPEKDQPKPSGKPCPSSCKGGNHHHSSESDDSDFEDGEVTDNRDRVSHEFTKKRKHPFRLHPDLWDNEPGETNEGLVCKCSLKSRRIGIRHGIYVGEDIIPPCSPFSNNVDRLYQYRVTLSPPTNFLVKYPTIINHDGHEFIFEGFSILSHEPIPPLPTCKVIRFNIEYTIIYIEEKLPENFTVKELDLFNEFFFKEVLEMYDFDLHGPNNRDGCPQYHLLPRFVRDIADNGKEILSMNEVLTYLLNSRRLLVDREKLGSVLRLGREDWQRYAEEVKEMVATKPGAKPSSVRVDQLDRDQLEPGKVTFPVIVHFGVRPPQLSYAGSPQYQKAWKEYVKFRHLLANMPKPAQKDKEKLQELELKLSAIRTTSSMKRDVTIAFSAEGFYRTGIMTDIVQHALLLPVLISHFRLHRSIFCLEKSINYTFKNRCLLQLALTHPSYRENYGTNPDHARNSLSNCGIRQPEYGDRKIHYQNMRKRGINTLINIMARFGKREATESRVTHNERLEFLGDAVVEFITSIHLYFMFPDVEEGGLATYRAAIVQNQHLAVLARKMKLDHFMLYAHGSDLCHELELRHAMANCFEALMGALFLDGGWEVADKVFGGVLFMGEAKLHKVWVDLRPHPLQEQEPNGDRQWIKDYPVLQKLTEFEDTTGIKFRHIRLLARSFTDRSIGMNNLTLGSNQRMEFLGDTVLQLIASEYLYKHFPDHHEGHLSLLRSSLVNNRTQAVVCDDLGLTKYAEFKKAKSDLKVKDKADLMEAFLGALYVDQGLEPCIVFCNVCFFPRLQSFILNQEWNDPKSKLQQCCLTLRTIGGGEPDIPQYKVIQARGPTNTRVYTVAVYFRGRRLSKASGFSIQSAEMQAATLALEHCEELFPQLQYQKKVISRSIRHQNIDKDKVLAEYDTERVHYKGFVENDEPDSDPELPRILPEARREFESKRLFDQDFASEGLEEAVKVLKGSAKKFEEKIMKQDLKSKSGHPKKGHAEDIRSEDNRIPDKSDDDDRIRNRNKDSSRDGRAHDEQIRSSSSSSRKPDESGRSSSSSSRKPDESGRSSSSSSRKPDECGRDERKRRRKYSEEEAETLEVIQKEAPKKSEKGKDQGKVKVKDDKDTVKSKEGTSEARERYREPEPKKKKEEKERKQKHKHKTDRRSRDEFGQLKIVESEKQRTSDLDLKDQIETNTILAAEVLGLYEVDGKPPAPPPLPLEVPSPPLEELIPPPPLESESPETTQIIPCQVIPPPPPETEIPETAQIVPFQVVSTTIALETPTNVTREISLSSEDESLSAETEKGKSKKLRKKRSKQGRKVTLELDPVSEEDDDIIFLEEKNMAKEVTEVQISDEEGYQPSNPILTNYIPATVSAEAVILPKPGLSRLVFYSDSEKELSEISDSEFEPPVIPKKEEEGEGPPPEIPAFGLIPSEAAGLLPKIELKVEPKLELKEEHFSDVSDGEIPDSVISGSRGTSGNDEASRVDRGDTSGTVADESLSEGEILD